MIEAPEDNPRALIRTILVSYAGADASSAPRLAIFRSLLLSPIEIILYIWQT